MFQVIQVFGLLMSNMQWNIHSKSAFQQNIVETTDIEEVFLLHFDFTLQIEAFKMRNI